MEELDGALPESGSKSKDESAMEIDGNQDEALVEVWQFMACLLYAYVCLFTRAMTNKNYNLKSFLSELIFVLCVLREQNVIIFPLSVTVFTVHRYPGLLPCI